MPVLLHLSRRGSLSGTLIFLFFFVFVFFPSYVVCIHFYVRLPLIPSLPPYFFSECILAFVFKSVHRQLQDGGSREKEEGTEMAFAMTT